MSASAAALTKTWQVGRYTATLTVPPLGGGVLHATVDWAPHTPNALTPEEVQAYRSGLASAFQALGLSALIVQI